MLRLLTLALTVAAGLATAQDTLFYSRTFPKSAPEYFDVTVERDGSAVYREAVDDEFPVEFEIEREDLEKIFGHAAALVGVEEQVPLEQKTAFTGDKLIRLTGPDGAVRSEAKFVFTMNADAQALARFYTEVGFPFLQGTERARSSLARDASSRLVFDGLRAHVSPQHHAKLDEVEAACREVRLRVEERRLRQLLFGWQVLHIPLGMAALVLLAAHVAVVLYY